MNPIRFQFQFDAQRTEQELQAIAKSFTPLPSIRVKDNQLTGIHLITPTPEGKKNKNGQTYNSTHELDKSPYLQSILNTFECDKLTYRVQNLKAKGKINLHRDSDRGLASKIVRIHIPITTNKEVYFHVNGERVCMQNGECWFADITQLHEVENRSDMDRLQLLIDCDLNDWWENILKEHGVELEKTSEWDNYTLEELQSIKENFSLMGVEHNQERIEKIDSAIAVKLKSRK